MTQYIDKAAIVAKIESYISNYKDIVAKIDRNDSTWVDSVSMIDARIDVLQHLLSFLDTLEVKEVNLEKEIKSWLDHGHITDTRYDDYDDNDIESTAKHFFELGMQQSKNDNNNEEKK